MQPEPSVLTCDRLGAAGALIFGDGTASGVVIVPRSLLWQICAPTDGSDGVAPEEHMGLLLGPEVQSDDLLIEEAIPLGSEFRLSHSLATLEAGIESVHLRLAEARERSQTIVGFYRILAPGKCKVSENDFEFLASNGQEHGSLLSARCCFVVVPLSASETSLRVLIRKGEHWERIQQVTLRSEPPYLNSIPEIAAPSLTIAQRAHRVAAPIAAMFQRRNRLWVNVTLVTLLLLSLAANILMVWFARRASGGTVTLQALTNQIRELSAAVSQLQASVTTPAPPEPLPAISKRVTATASPKRISILPARLAIARKPTMLRPSETFEFKVQGDPVPEVVWSSEGPGSIDPFYGLYRAPNQFTGETKVKVTATSWMGSQSATFTLRGTPR